jgi:hypothetical protein
MKLRFLALFFFVSSCLCQNSASSESGETLAGALRGATSPFTLTAKGKLADTGGKLMADAIEHAQFVLIGESHYSRETPRLAAAICWLMHPDSYAVEAGPYAAAYVNGLLKDPERTTRMKEGEHAHAASMAFLNAEQENDLAASCAASTRNKDFALWGLDQEFQGAASVLLQQMKVQPNGRVSSYCDPICPAGGQAGGGESAVHGRRNATVSCECKRERRGRTTGSLRRRRHTSQPIHDARDC